MQNTKILTVSGRTWDYANPNPDDFSIEDAAHALSQEPRFSGMCSEFYSVAEHCLLVASLVPKDLMLQGLVHDLHEAYYKDIPTPFKGLIPQYKATEMVGARAIRRAVGVPDDLHPAVTEADHSALNLERAALLPENSWWPKKDPALLPAVSIKIRTWRQSRDAFLEEYHRLKSGTTPHLSKAPR